MRSLGEIREKSARGRQGHEANREREGEGGRERERERGTGRGDDSPPRSAISAGTATIRAPTWAGPWTREEQGDGEHHYGCRGAGATWAGDLAQLRTMGAGDRQRIGFGVL